MDKIGAGAVSIAQRSHEGGPDLDNHTFGSPEKYMIYLSIYKIRSILTENPQDASAPASIVVIVLSAVCVTVGLLAIVVCFVIQR